MNRKQGRYIVRGEIASGSTATVFLAEDAVLRRKVALKKLHPHLLGHDETVARFGKEAVAVASLSHENIIRVYDFGNEGGNLFLAMEFVDGWSLERLLEAGRPLPALVSLSVFRQVLRGLEAAHAAGIVHRDIKPSNLLLDRKGMLRIADFGIAFLAEEKSITRTGSYMGTPVYSSPEQAQGLPASARSDIFSTGILFYRCLTGRLPFDGANSHAILASIIERMPPKPIQHNRRILPGLGELVERMLSKDPERRPDAARCLAELDGIAAKHGLSMEPERVSRYMEDTTAYADAEGRELRDHFLEAALEEEGAGNARAAVKLAALAELHSDLDAGALEAASRIAGKGKALQRRKLALAFLVLAALAAGMSAVREYAGRSSHEKAPDTASPTEEGPVPALARRVVPAGTASTTLTLPTAVAAAPRVPAQIAEASPSPVVRRPKPPPASPRPKRPGPAVPPAPREGEFATGFRPPPIEEAAPPAASGYLMVKTNPPFARVSLGGRALGTTPFKAPIELPEGAHELLLEREGCAPLRSTVRIRPGETASLRLLLERAQPSAR